MHLFLHRESRVARPLWLGLAVFFLVFCSSPVKKYIRMQLYKHHPVVERTHGSHLSSYNVKDCLIADRDNQAKISISQVYITDGAPDVTTGFLLPCIIAMTYLLLFVQFIQKPNPSPQRWRMAAPMPRYLMVRHLQV